MYLFLPRMPTGSEMAGSEKGSSHGSTNGTGKRMSRFLLGKASHKKDVSDA